jgi:NADP-dependent 3-hydroxy acid dehydrogenase YdfG
MSLFRYKIPTVPQRVLVVGASSFIVQAALRYWAIPGATLVLVGRDDAKLQAVARDCTVRGASVMAHVVPDLSNPTPKLAEIIAQTFEALGGLDGALIAHGELPEQTHVQDDPLAIVRQTMINGTSVAIWLALLAPRFEAQRAGWIAAISSVAADRGRAKMYVYGAAKALVSHHLAGLRQRLNAAHVRVIDLRPGPIATPMTATLGKMPLLATPAAIAPLLVGACGQGNTGANGTVYLPKIWRLIMGILQHVPEFIWVKMKF